MESTDGQRHTRAMAFAAVGLIVSLPVLWAFYRPASWPLDVVGYPLGRDFINVWVGPQMAFGGKLALLFQPIDYWSEASRLFGQRIPFHFWSYPPTALGLFWPFAQLPYAWALAAWTLGLFTAFAAVALSPLPPERRPPALLLLAVAPASLINIAGGQNGFLTAALLLGGMLLIDRRPWLAGVLFGLLTFKPHLGFALPLVLLALGAWRTIAAAVATTVLMVAWSTAVLGLEPWRLFVTETSGYGINALVEFKGFFALMTTSVLAGARTVGLSYDAGSALQIAVAIVVLPVAALAARQTCDPVRRAAVVASATLLVTPYAMSYDMPMVAAVVVWLLAGRSPLRPATLLACLAAWVVPTAMIHANNAGLPIGTPALIALFAVAVIDALHGKPLVPEQWRNSLTPRPPVRVPLP